VSIRILIADDQSVIRRLKRALLESRAEWKVCGESADKNEVVVALPNEVPHGQKAPVDAGLA
jgi:DNA-binding NarL/FixJ family response regulator